MLDGTWDEARKLLARNPSLQRLRKASLRSADRRSRYVVRTQPADACLSTVESVAEALAAVEEGWSGEQVDALCAPLDAMCNIQGRDKWMGWLWILQINYDKIQLSH